MPGDPSTALKVLLAGQLIEDPAPKLQCSGHLGPATRLVEKLHRYGRYGIAMVNPTNAEG